MRVLTGIQSTNFPHLGNILGAIKPALLLAKNTKEPSLFFIADLHALTIHPDKTEHKHFVLANAATWLAFGLDPEQNILYRQSHVPQVCELAWYLSCLTPYSTLTKAHAFKDKANNTQHINAGLFTYPILMAADILLYHATHIPVGTDQRQHIEITRNLAARFNHHYGTTFTLPQPYHQENLPTVPGTDGRKMSKSYHNTIFPFAPEKQLKKTIMSIPTDTTPLHQSKNPDTCTIFKLYRLLATPEQTLSMQEKYLNGGYGYGDAKHALLQLIINNFEKNKTIFQKYMHDTSAIEDILSQGEAKAQKIAIESLQKIRKKLNLLPS